MTDEAPQPPVAATGAVGNPPGVSFDLVAYIMAWENGELGYDETVRLFQWLVDTGTAWKLQSVYGRTAMAMIEAGVVAVPPRS